MQPGFQQCRTLLALESKRGGVPAFLGIANHLAESDHRVCSCYSPPGLDADDFALVLRPGSAFLECLEQTENLPMPFASNEKCALSPEEILL